MTENQLFTDQDGSFAVVKTDDVLSIKIHGFEAQPITEAEANDLRQKDRAEFRFDRKLGRIRRKTQSERKDRPSNR